jgi:hypothetical protein
MKHLLLTTIAAVVLLGCGEPQQSTTTPVTQPEVILLGVFTLLSAGAGVIGLFMLFI